ncbi:DUF885 domain-containing protein [Sporichthya brevicatena]|uniref:DUF885 domain-containing protein n=1 Tax=Sporichthya brevicatena TaxID=171442 RepID=A0ABP3SIG3_9ACTN
MTTTANGADYTEAFVAAAAAILDEHLALDPVTATALGDHRFDDRLPATGSVARADELARRTARLDELAALPPAASAAESVDREILAHHLRRRVFELTELREHAWNPLEANPGTALHLLLAREFAPAADRIRSMAGRLAAVPATLTQARADLEAMPAIHVETAIGQFTGTRTLIATELERTVAAANDPGLRALIEPAAEAATEALTEHLAWLSDRLPEATGDPRLGPELFARRLRLTLDTDDDPDTLLARAESELERISEEIAETAARIDGGRPGPGQVRRVLDGLAAEAPTNHTIVGLAEQTLVETTAFVRERDLVTVHDDPVEIVVMPEIHRGVAVAYCDPPGPLETANLPTFYAISPTPADWPAERVTSFFREYNCHMLRNLTIHEAMPGHVLQLAHDRRCVAPTKVRAAFWSGPFVEGWAVYSEELMARHGFGGDALRMQQLKMQLRMTINTILDVRVHTRGMTQDEAMALMTGRGHQEEGEAHGKWRRSLLTSTQLSTYFVGYLGVRDLVAEVRAAAPGATEREVHDRLLAHGSPPPRHLRTLLGL